MSELSQQTELPDVSLLLIAWEISRLSVEDLWMGYRRVGGARSLRQIRAILAGDVCADYDHNLLALCLNRHLQPENRVKYQAGPE